jgi:hypothetical protein
MNMKFKFMLLTFLAGVFASSGGFCMENDKDDILPPNVANYSGKGPIGKWNPKKEDIFVQERGLNDKKKIQIGEPLYPYHAWIKYEDKGGCPLHCIFIAADCKRKVSFVLSEGENGPIDPKKYVFEKTTNLGLIKSPYLNRKTNGDEGHKFDAWEEKKFWDQMPNNLPVNTFPMVFKYVGSEEK